MDQEFTYKWMTINYLLGNFGKKCHDTVGFLDLSVKHLHMVHAESIKSLDDPQDSKDVRNVSKGE